MKKSFVAVVNGVMVFLNHNMNGIKPKANIVDKTILISAQM